MRTAVLLIAGVVIVTAAAAKAPAPSRLSGTLLCGKADPAYVVPVGDQSNHVAALSQAKCTWSDGQIAGSKIVEEDTTLISDILDFTARDQGYGVIKLASGDKAFIRFEGTSILKDRQPMAARGTWILTGGTGALSNIKGQGTYKGTSNPDDTSALSMSGDYQLPVVRLPD